MIRMNRTDSGIKMLSNLLDVRMFSNHLFQLFLGLSGFFGHIFSMGQPPTGLVTILDRDPCTAREKTANALQEPLITGTKRYML